MYLNISLLYRELNNVLNFPFYMVKQCSKSRFHIKLYIMHYNINKPLYYQFPL